MKNLLSRVVWAVVFVALLGLATLLVEWITDRAREAVLGKPDDEEDEPDDDEEDETSSRPVARARARR